MIELNLELILITFILYSIIAHLSYKKYNTLIPDNINIWGPSITIRSNFGLKTVERLSIYKNIWNYWGYLGVFFALIGAFAGVIFMFISVIGLYLNADEVVLYEPQDMLVIPGVNQFLPLDAAPEIILALIIGMVVHEFGHAVYCRVANMEVKSTGLIFLSIIPLGAFVEPNMDQALESDVIEQLKMYSAGIMNNILIFFVSLIGLYLLVSSFVVVASGVGVSEVLDDSPAFESDIETGDRITGIDDEQVDSEEELLKELENGANTIEVNEDDSREIETLSYIMQSPKEVDLDIGMQVIGVDNNEIKSSYQFNNELKNIQDYTTEIELKGGTLKEIPIGAYYTIQDDQIINESESDISAGDSIVVFEINEERVYNEQTFIDELKTEENIKITYWSDGDIKTEELNIESEDHVVVSEYISGINSSTLGIHTYPSQDFLDILSFDSSSSILTSIYQIILLPFAALTPFFNTNFPGFTSLIQNFYEINNAPSNTHSLIFFTISTLFWTAWLNINLAIFNCLPTYTLDGGHITRTISFDVIGEYTTERISKILSLTIKTLTLIIILSVVLAPLVI